MPTAHRRGRVTVIGPHATWMYSTADGHKHAVTPGEFLEGFKEKRYRAECGHELVRAWPSETPDFPPPCDECLKWWYVGLADRVDQRGAAVADRPTLES